MKSQVVINKWVITSCGIGEILSELEFPSEGFTSLQQQEMWVKKRERERKKTGNSIEEMRYMVVMPLWFTNWVQSNPCSETMHAFTHLLNSYSKLQANHCIPISGC